MASQPSITSFFKRKSSEDTLLKEISPNKKVNIASKFHYIFFSIRIVSILNFDLK